MIKLLRSVLCVTVFLTSGCSSLPPELARAIAYGEVRELNELSPGVKKQLLLRLYSAPSQDQGCGEGTHIPCGYVHYLSVSTFDEHPLVNVYRLSFTVDAQSLEWRDEQALDTAVIKVSEVVGSSETIERTFRVTPRGIRELF